MKIITTSILALLLSQTVFAGEVINTTVNNAGINSHGQVFITFSDVLLQDGCEGRYQLLLAVDSAIKDQVLSVALSAKATGNTVQIKPAGCLGTSPSLLLNYSPHGWFMMK